MRTVPYGLEWRGRPRCRAGALWFGLLLSGCAGAPVQPPDTSSPPTATPFRVGDRVIPPVLLQAVEDPYRQPVPGDCAALASEVAALDVVLGPDADAADPAQRSDAIADAFAGALRSLIPYRGVLRLVTGANAREKRALAAIAAGDRRRAYLKGLAEARRCPSPPAPIHKPASEDQSERAPNVSH